ncbi:MAG TPA: hypothetical protein DCE52_02975 [Rhodobacteraceae bacterium]|nr:hypothetical protein [Paracoccaceae bacterium]
MKYTPLIILFFAQSVYADETMDEIKTRCTNDMKGYGASIVKACIDSDLEVIPSIIKYQESHPKTARRCLTQMRSYGFTIVNACIKQDVDAQEAIDNY